ncbi:type III secretion protein C [Pseudomonas sp. URIL14HWK12:I9]|nr:type III secretion protein C [Pseudomonas sp. URIL14HWK12:I12]PVZ23318.1 type III secretion protein C [Pseudomonas sp. URIL14HWK12:I10]PVZ32648.1 type III secretion protein C [Pseudomonas sp. URIL14HWK12:I11]SNZ13802.1 type III secretion protein C [Pseudomonas sp. URIL14HWK12:I9]
MCGESTRLRRLPQALLQPVAGWLFGALALLLAGTCQAAESDDPQWFSAPYPYVLVEQDLRSAMDAFAQQLKLTVVFSDKVRGKSRGVVRGTQAGEFLQNLCAVNGLTWYFDGNVLYLNSADEVASRLLRPGQASLEELRSYLGGLDVYGERLAMRLNETGDELLVSGPPPYLALVQQHIDQQRRPAQIASTPRSHGVRVFRGNSVTEVNPN